MGRGVAGMVKSLNKNAQSTIEYALLFTVVMAAFIAVQFYINRHVQGRLKQIQDEINEPVVDETGTPF